MRRRTALVIIALLLAAFGTTVTWAYARGAEQRARGDMKLVHVWAAGQLITAGTPGEKVVPEGVDLPNAVVPPGAISDSQGLNGKIALQPIQKGQPLVLSMFGSASQVGAERINGVSPDHTLVALKGTDPGIVRLLKIGDIISLYRSTPGQALVLAPRVRVATVDPLMIEVNPKDAERILVASRAGLLDVTLPGSKAVVPGR